MTECRYDPHNPAYKPSGCNHEFCLQLAAREADEDREIAEGVRAMMIRASIDSHVE